MLTTDEKQWLKNTLKEADKELNIKKDKIGFILSSRAVKEPKLKNDSFYQYLFNEYLSMSLNEIDIEFNFYINK